MAEAFIRKQEPAADGLDFSSLRNEGIRLTQEISGDIWTDYNLHDPGVTVLESLCYALTDLAYRAGFSAADLLTETDGQIDYEALALHRPDEIFPCRALTESDYRKLILNAVPNIDNVWVERIASGSGGMEGLYSIRVLLNERVTSGTVKDHAEMAGRVYAANRNLCEDLAGEVVVVERIPYMLVGEIEIDGKRDASSLLAEIYFISAQYLTPHIVTQSYAEMQRDGHGFDELFDGVLTSHGHIDANQLHPWLDCLSADELNNGIADLSGRIAQINGVKSIGRLYFRPAPVARMPEPGTAEWRRAAVASLKLPESDADIGIVLHKAGKPFQVAFHDVDTEYARLDYKLHAHRRQKEKFDWVSTLMPSGTFRNVNEYFSIQHHFPAIYGINAAGVPASAPAQRKAQAAQLKAYLLFFEQLMANFLQNMQEIPNLFSLRKSLQHTTFQQFLGNEKIPDIEAVYLFNKDTTQEKLAAQTAEFDDFDDRRNRALDYLLALHGEKLGINSLRQHLPPGTDAHAFRIDSKVAFLRAIVAHSRNRAAASNYRKPYGDNNFSGLQEKLEILLGLEVVGSSGARTGMHIVEHILLRPRGASNHSGHLADAGFYSSRLSIVVAGCQGNFCKPEFRTLMYETVYLNCPAHIYPQIFWLDAQQMQHFESLHARWQSCRLASHDPADTDAAAEDLALFLQQDKGRRHD